jgi:hypothetical protein
MQTSQYPPNAKMMMEKLIKETLLGKTIKNGNNDSD